MAALSRCDRCERQTIYFLKKFHVKLSLKYKQAKNITQLYVSFTIGKTSNRKLPVLLILLSSSSSFLLKFEFGPVL